jgi:hypothetical protein
MLAGARRESNWREGGQGLGTGPDLATKKKCEGLLGRRHIGDKETKQLVYRAPRGREPEAH